MVPLAVASAGCSFNLGATVGPSIDTAGKVGVDKRWEAGLTLGGEDSRASAALGGGVGYSGAHEQAYAVVAPAAGFEYGHKVKLGIEAVYAPRFLLGRSDVVHAGGGDIQLLVPAYYSPSDFAAQAVYLGPRFSAEYMAAGGGEPARGVFTLSLVFRGAPFDTTVGF
ncbi:MAG: hypothetical protein U0271_24130 [Polyangiaceae bacterium]